MMIIVIWPNFNQNPAKVSFHDENVIGVVSHWASLIPGVVSPLGLQTQRALKQIILLKWKKALTSSVSMEKKILQA